MYILILYAFDICFVPLDISKRLIHIDEYANNMVRVANLTWTFIFIDLEFTAAALYMS